MRNLLSAAEAGFAGLNVDPSFRESALSNLAIWLENPQVSDTIPQLEALIDGEKWDILLDGFYQVLPFGTGGRRGPVGIGTNRYNIWTLSTSIQGHALFLRAQAKTDEPLSVVIAYDVRCYKDSRGIYRSDLPNPLMGLSSRDFAEIAAGVYAANGVHVHMLGRGSKTYISTPELSFAIRHLRASGGLNVSASHNPSDDNGAKIYDSHGGQAVPPWDEQLADEVAKVTQVERLSYQESLDGGWISELGEDVHQAYIQANLAVSLRPGSRDCHVVFTPLHGTGDTTVAQVLRAAGFQVTLEPTQSTYDGDFPNVPFGVPNPEVAQSMDRAVALARELGADLVMSCDPDADRLGLVVRHGDGWRVMTGNELGTLVVRYLLAFRRSRTGRAPIIIKTEVTSSLVARVARHHGAKVVGHLLVGFKYIGDGIRRLEQVGRFYNVEGDLQDFAAGIEESHGVLVTHAVRDKDAAGAALLLAEASAWQKSQGRTLFDLLEDCWRDVGGVANTLRSLVMLGAEGRMRIQAIQASLRDDPPREIGGRTVTAFFDRQDPRGPFGRIKSGTDAVSRDVLVFELGPDSRVILRPSGTEPKSKVYVEVSGAAGREPSEVLPELLAEAARLGEDFVLELLGRVDLVIPRWSLSISDLVATEHKAHFSSEVLPALVDRLAGGEDVAVWLDARITAYGKDARTLVAPGVAAWLACEQRSTETDQALRKLFDLSP
jgi:phosphoglucomutase/phosphomannomutase